MKCTAKSAILLLSAIAALLFSGCIPSIHVQEQWIAELREKYHQQILDHFNENEELFNRFATMLFELIENDENFSNYTDISFHLGSAHSRDRDIEDRYFFRINRPHPLERLRILYEDIDTYGKLTYDELDKMLFDDLGYHFGLVHYSIWRENFIIFHSRNGSRNSWVRADLIYSRLGSRDIQFRVGDRVNIKYWISDYWFILYFVYMH